MKSAIKTGDAILLCAVILGVCLGGAWLWLNSANVRNFSANGTVVITQTRDGLRRVDPLSVDASFTVETEGTGAGEDADGGVNVVRIESGRVRVERANCGNQLCVEHDPIASEGEQIVCLPHGMVVEVVADESDAAVLQQR